MRQFRLFGGIEGYYRWMNTVISINRNQGNATAQYRLKVLQHFWEFGLHSTVSAFPVSRATLFRWQKAVQSKGKLDALLPHSTRPKQVRQMQVLTQVKEKIKQLRQDWPNLSKHKLKPLIDVFCQEWGYPCISTSTIGKVIARNHYFFTQNTPVYHDPQRKKRTGKEKIRVWKAPKQEQGYIEADLVETRVDGMKKYTVCWIDIGSKVALSKSYSRKTSKNIVDSFLAFEAFLPGTIHTFQTDNGSEFEGALDTFLRTQRPHIQRRYIPVRSPKINGVVERYNRSLQDDWLNHHLDLFHDEETWNQSLAQYIDFYNFYRIHDTLKNRTPMQAAGVQQSLKCP